MKDSEIDVNSVDEIVIVVPEEAIKDGELELDLEELGIDIESLGEEVNIVIQVEGAEELCDDGLDDEDYLDEPNEWQFDDDPYNVVYYEFPDEDDEE
ncbi:hypothetical protein [Methanobrevibacter sp.]|uniref:hypothetical protein n=1 Tax=Methanobrevibacter sp. TaxID=66852 RepID=UPI0025D1270D|nr:hypothetical protein [Methanobrevibacter sp.]MBR4447415.1 hypothetical protein [Methanobrevibacter sp.]